MTRRFLLPLVLVAALLVPRAGYAADFLAFPIKISLPVHMIIIGFEVDRVVKTTLKEKDLVNLALGRPLKSKVDKKTEVLAVALTTEGPSMSPAARLVVFNPAQNAVVTVVAQATGLDFESIPGGRGQGTLIGAVQQTTLGTPGENALNATTILASGAGSVGPLVPPGLATVVSLSGVVTGRLSFKSANSTFSGFILDGKAKVSGKVLGAFSQ